MVNCPYCDAELDPAKMMERIYQAADDQEGGHILGRLGDLIQGEEP